MMLKKVIYLTIPLLLICFVSWSQISKSNNSSTGKLLRTDTAKVLIPINVIRDANAKLIERVYLIKINNHKDSIINLNKSYINEQYNVIKVLQIKIVNLTNDNNKLNNKIIKQRNNNKLLLGMATTSTIIAIVSFLIK